MAALCQDCTGCCQVFEVKGVKAFAEPCKHLGSTPFGQGCTIYESRPVACQHYVCFWLDGERRGGEFKQDPRLRPDVCKCVIGWPWGVDRETIHVYPYPDHPNAWRTGIVRDFIRGVLARGGKVVVYQDSDHIFSLKGDMAFVGTEAEFAELTN